jgi:hypothetical protein
LKINERLHLVVPIYPTGEDTATPIAFVHSAPLTREAFEAHFLLLSKTFAAIYSEGLGEIAGPRVASLILREVSKKNRHEDSHRSLMNEIWRLSNVALKRPEGWVTVPFQEAIDQSLLDDEDLAEVENAIVFFIVASSMLQRRTAAEMLPGAATLWGAQISSHDFTAFAASLPTSNAIANTGESRKLGSSVAY